MDNHVIAWTARFRIVRPNAVYNHTWGIEGAWRDNFDAWGYPLEDTEQDVTVGNQTYKGRTFHKIGLVYWEPSSGATVLGW